MLEIVETAFQTDEEAEKESKRLAKEEPEVSLIAHIITDKLFGGE